MRCNICDDLLPVNHPFDQRTKKLLPCQVCLDVIKSTLDGFKKNDPESTTTHDPATWEELNNDERDPADLGVSEDLYGSDGISDGEQ